MRSTGFLSVIIATLVVPFVSGCGEQAEERAQAMERGLSSGERAAEAQGRANLETSKAAAAEAGRAAETLEGNAERSARIMDDTYDAERKEGTGAIEAAGDAYNAVLDEPLEEEEKKAREKAGQP